MSMSDIFVNWFSEDDNSKLISMIGESENGIDVINLIEDAYGNSNAVWLLDEIGLDPDVNYSVDFLTKLRDFINEIK